MGAVAVGWTVAGRETSRRALALQVGLLAVLGAAPDLDLLIGRHSRETHSVGAAVIAASIAAWWRWPLAPTRARVWATACLAYLSHPIFDALSPDTSAPIGVMLFWPFSTAHWITGLDVFAPIWRDWHGSKFFSHNSVALLRELLILGPILAAVWWLGRTRVVVEPPPTLTP